MRAIFVTLTTLGFCTTYPAKILTWLRSRLISSLSSQLCFSTGSKFYFSEKNQKKNQTKKRTEEAGAYHKVKIHITWYFIMLLYLPRQPESRGHLVLLALDPLTGEPKQCGCPIGWMPTQTVWQPHTMPGVFKYEISTRRCGAYEHRKMRS